MKKNASILIVTASFTLIASAYLFFLFYFKSVPVITSEPPSQVVQKIEASQNLQQDQGSQEAAKNVTVVSQKLEAQQKIEKAIYNIRKKSRSPTGQLKIDAEFLQSHAAFAGTRWKLLAKVRAVSSDMISESDVVVGQMSRYQLVEIDGVDSNLNRYDRSSPAVVYETRLKRPGIVTGLIKVETDQKSSLQAVLAEMNAKISDSFDNIDTYFVTSEQTVFDLENLYMQIKSLSFVRSAELDILDREYEKK